VIDESGSIGTRNFDLMKDFMSHLVSRLDVDSGYTRVGIVSFSSSVLTSINLNAHTSLAGLQSAINALTYSGGGTNTFLALEHVRTTMLTSAAGDRSGVPNVVVVLTDGQSHNTTLTKVSFEFTECFLSHFLWQTIYGNAMISVTVVNSACQS